jgi:mRNA interferase MazF
MPIQFPVAPGTILLCDYSGGFRPPEMVKRRPVIVVSPRLQHRDNLCAVVPLSTTPPVPELLPYVCRLDLEKPLPSPFDAATCWAKADMIATVGFARLDLFRTERDRETGRRRYYHPRLPAAELVRVRAAVLHGLGLGHLTPHLK